MRGKRETLEKKDKDLKLKKIVKQQRLQEKGITLIALVVTIIILLILSGVTLNIALSDNGLFSKTKKATEDYKEAQSEEEEAIRQISTQLYSEYVGATVEGYSPKENTVKIDGITSGVNSKTDANGNAIANENIQEDGSQTFTTDSMSWRVWDYDGNILRIIGDPTTQKLTLQGAAGYNNGVWAIEKICRELYSNEAKGAKATSLKRTDIQKVSTYDYTQYKHNPDNYEEDSSEGDGNSIYFGATKTYTDNHKYPAMWGENDREWTYEYKDGKSTGIDEECKKWEEICTDEGLVGSDMNDGNESTIFKQSYYYHEYNENEFINDEDYDLIFEKINGQPTGAYWLAGRYVHLFESFCTFGLQQVDAYSSRSNVGGYILYHSARFYE